MLYRGQVYGEPAGEWWTESLAEAKQFAMSRGGNHSYVVLALDEDDKDWLEQYKMFERSSPYSPDMGDWYRIPMADLKERWRGVTIVYGALNLGLDK